jgi:hypothetical protein
VSRPSRSPLPPWRSTAALAVALHAALATGCRVQGMAIGEGGSDAQPEAPPISDASPTWDVGRDGGGRVLEPGTREVVALFPFEFVVPAGIRLVVDNEGINPTLYRAFAVDDGREVGVAQALIGGIPGGGPQRRNHLGAVYSAWVVDGPSRRFYQCRFTEVFNLFTVSLDAEHWRDELCDSGSWIAAVP